MIPNNNKSKNYFTITKEQIIEILRPERNPEMKVKAILYGVGAIFSFLVVVGALLGFQKAFNKFLKNEDFDPTLVPLHPITRAGMIIWAIALPLVIVLLCILLGLTLLSLNGFGSPALVIYIISNLIISLAAFNSFDRWRADIYNEKMNNNRFGSAREARPSELEDLIGNRGIYIGNGYLSYSKFGHMLLCAGARGGKGTNLLVPNLLGKSNYKGSWVVIDPKGELSAISARYQRQIGQNVIVLDPWGINGHSFSTYNPLDLLSGVNEEHLSDDADIIAEMIVPKDSKNKDPFWDDKARTIIGGLIMHMVLKEPKENRTLTKLWEWLRYDLEQWAGIVADMKLSDNRVIAGVANDLFSLKEMSDRTYVSVMTTVQNHTDFLKSPALQKSLAPSNFNINDLSKGKTTLYVVIPADKVTTHAKWLRLVTGTALKSVVRNHDKRVTFMMDEFAALGYMSEIEIGMGAYAGYNITLWPVLQNLSQLKNLYRDNWETFLGNAAIKEFFSVSDQFTMKYLSDMLGEKTFVTYEQTSTGAKPHSTSRKLFTPDEIRRGSADNIFLLAEQKPVTIFPKLPYYKMSDLAGRDDPNPYMTPENNNG